MGINGENYRFHISITCVIGKVSNSDKVGFLVTVEQVVLVDDRGEPTGVCSKADVHTRDTPLHLAFSCYVFNAKDEVLVTRRSLEKVAWPGVWTNSFCGHPLPGESMEQALRRRSGWELGIEVTAPRVVLPGFQYRAVDVTGIVENEICPVYFAFSEGTPDPRPAEVMDFRWAKLDDLRRAASAAPWAFSPWLVLQLRDDRLQAARVLG
ncbi:isopentenyl-diphosphate Delta-isomerase [Paenarthrobacter sp. NPDC089989]